MRLHWQLSLIYLLVQFACVFSATAAEFEQTLVTEADQPSGIPAIVEADSIVGKSSTEIEMLGNAILSKGDQSIRADQLQYFQNTQHINAQGGVILQQQGSSVSGPRLQLNLDTNIGSMEQPNFYFTENAARGSADKMDIRDKKHYSFAKASYTTCPADDQDWQLKMSGLLIDRDRQIGTARNTWVEFMSVPILYTPWMDFALNDQRKTGFISPIFGGTVNGGSEITVPYYWNISANRDATIAPRIMLKRGLMLNNEFRYLEKNYAGEAHVDVLPNDKLTKATRTHFNIKHKQALNNNLSMSTDLNRVSDDAYFRDLADTVNATSQANLMREGTVNYLTGDWLATARAQRFQTLQDPAALIIAPYARLPQLTLSTQRYISGVNVSFASEFVDFRHPTSPNGNRLVFNPSVSYPLVNSTGFYTTPKIGLHSTYYSMGVNKLATQPNNALRNLPILSIDSGVALERTGQLAGIDYAQTLEPRLFYVYVPYKDQSLLPNFDSAQADFNFTQMFTENRFFGSDRVGDSNQLTAAVTSRWLAQDTGAERLKIIAGQRFNFNNPQVNLVTPTTSSSKSDILLSASGQMTRAWSLDSELQYDPNQSHIQRYNLATHYRPEAGKTLNVGYRFTRNLLRQADISTQWPLFGRWHALAKWNYSLQDARILEAIAGLEYNQSCWTLRLVAQRFATATQQTNTSLFVQLELNDLLRMGSDPLTLLKQSVPGYTKLNDSSKR
ncbi:MAG: LPS-assembly protein LptD [Sideroxydans sp.]|nr:LPS-assembly protein LptD [Sideroxydans sp.]